MIVDDFFTYTWVMFLAHKNDDFHEFSKLCRKIQNEKGSNMENIEFESFCDEHEIEYNFSAFRTSQQNEVVERKNRILQEMARTVFRKNNLPTYI